MKKYLPYIIFILFVIIVLLPPIMHGDKLLRLNHDTVNHLNFFESMKKGNTNFLYTGQAIVGYLLIEIEKLTRINIPVLFMWFNYIAMLLAGIATAALVVITTKSKMAGAISAFVIVFGIGSSVHLFWSGTIFNIIEFLVLLPITLAILYLILKERKIKWLYAFIPLVAILFFFHPSLFSGIKYLFNNSIAKEAVINPIYTIAVFFGIFNVIVIIVCLFSLKRITIDKPTKIIIAILATGYLAMEMASVMNVTPFSSRMAINSALLLGIIMCILIGITLEKEKLITPTLLIVPLILFSIIPNLIQWFTWTSLA